MPRTAGFRSLLGDYNLLHFTGFFWVATAYRMLTNVDLSAHINKLLDEVTFEEGDEKQHGALSRNYHCKLCVGEVKGI